MTQKVETKTEIQDSQILDTKTPLQKNIYLGMRLLKNSQTDSSLVSDKPSRSNISVKGENSKISLSIWDNKVLFLL